VRDILDYQIAFTRQTLEVFYTLSASWEQQRRRHGVDFSDRQSKAVRRAVRQLFVPNGETQSYAGRHGPIHGMPQRLRACYSLLRGAFSVGTLSRLKATALSDNDAVPFESYSEWLRSLCNAAVGLEWNRHSISAVLRCEVFGDPVSKGRLSEKGETITATTAILERQRRILDLDPLDPEKVPEAFRDLRRKIYSTALSSGSEERQSSAQVYQKIRHPFFRDEIAWLYNERGLTALMQGRIFDAMPLFGIAARVVESENGDEQDRYANGSASRRIMLNIAIAQIERGHIAEARSKLTFLKETVSSNLDKVEDDIAHFATGYIALCDHLSGSVEAAREGYGEAISALVDRRRLRGVSIFNRHASDLDRFCGNVSGAISKVDLALAAAAQAEQLDVQYLSLISKARVMIADGKAEDAMPLLTRALQYAPKLGLYGLQVDAEIARARFMLGARDIASASEAAARGVALATRHGMRLRKLGALTLYAETQVAHGRTEIAEEILVESKTEAERLGYQTQANRISDILARELGV